jgi:hypothetical protein
MARSEAWNSALVMAESGAEEALAQVNPGVSVASIDFWANGWGLPADGLYGPKSRSLTNGFYRVVFTDSPYPVIYSTGSVMVAGSGTALTRVIEVTTTNFPIYNVPFGAVYKIVMNGGGISTDSFDSSKPWLSNNGHYDPSLTSTNGDVFSINGPVDLGQHSINGDLYIGPTVKYASSTDQVTGEIHNDLNISFPPVVPPNNFSNWPAPLLALPQTINGVTYKYVLSTGNYTISDSGSIYIPQNANVNLRITAANFNPAALTVAGTGAYGTGDSGKLTIYMAGASCTLPGGGALQNDNAANFSYYGLTSNTSITFGGNSVFVGTIYAPNADLTLNGGGSGTGLTGASITKSITMNGHYDFHFDEALLKVCPVMGYIPVSWREL